MNAHSHTNTDSPLNLSMCFHKYIHANDMKRGNHHNSPMSFYGECGFLEKYEQVFRAGGSLFRQVKGWVKVKVLKYSLLHWNDCQKLFICGSKAFTLCVQKPWCLFPFRKTLTYPEATLSTNASQHLLNCPFDLFPPICFCVFVHRSLLESTNSPVVFCHNDCQEGRRSTAVNSVKYIYIYMCVYVGIFIYITLPHHAPL